jgi:hypothetical protein
MEPPETQYTRSGDVNIAYQVVGEGPLDLVYIPAVTHHLELVWEVPRQARFLGLLAALGRLLLLDKRGSGMSDRAVGSPTLETRMDDIRAVMDAADSERAVLMGVWDGGALGRYLRPPIRSGRLPSSSSTRRRASSATQNFHGCRRGRRTSEPVRRSCAGGATASGSRRNSWGHTCRARRRRSSRPSAACTGSASAPELWPPTGG